MIGVGDIIRHSFTGTLRSLACETSSEEFSKLFPRRIGERPEQTIEGLVETLAEREDPSLLIEMFAHFSREGGKGRFEFDLWPRLFRDFDLQRETCAAIRACEGDRKREKILFREVLRMLYSERRMFNYKQDNDEPHGYRLGPKSEWTQGGVWADARHSPPSERAAHLMRTVKFFQSNEAQKLMSTYDSGRSLDAVVACAVEWGGSISQNHQERNIPVTVAQALGGEAVVSLLTRLSSEGKDPTNPAFYLGEVAARFGDERRREAVEYSAELAQAYLEVDKERKRKGYQGSAMDLLLFYLATAVVPIGNPYSDAYDAEYAAAHPSARQLHFGARPSGQRDIVPAQQRIEEGYFRNLLSLRGEVVHLSALHMPDPASLETLVVGVVNLSGPLGANPQETRNFAKLLVHYGNSPCVDVVSELICEEARARWSEKEAIAEIYEFLGHPDVMRVAHLDDPAVVDTMLTDRLAQDPRTAMGYSGMKEEIERDRRRKEHALRGRILCETFPGQARRYMEMRKDELLRVFSQEIYGDALARYEEERGLLLEEERAMLFDAKRSRLLHALGMKVCRDPDNLRSYITRTRDLLERSGGTSYG